MVGHPVRLGLVTPSPSWEKKLTAICERITGGAPAWVCRRPEEVAQVVLQAEAKVDAILCTLPEARVRSALEQGWGKEARLLCGSIEEMVADLCRYLIYELNRQRKEERIIGIGMLAERMAHDLRNPITAIAGFGQILGQPDLTPWERAECLKNLREASQRMLTLLDEVVLFVQEATPSFEPEAMEVKEFLHRAALPLRGELVKHKIKLKLVPGPKARIKGDFRRLCLAMGNLLLNSKEAMSQGGTITLTWKKENGRVNIKVADTGGGIAPSIVERVFEPLATFGKSGRMGLGLATARKIAREHGGDLRLVSTSGKGTVFHLGIPEA